MFWIRAANAMAPGGQAAPADGMGPMINNVFFFVLIFAVFYFLLIRPQQKRAKEHRAMLAALKVGDSVLTTGGIIGTVVSLTDLTVVLDLGETKITVGRSFVSGLATNSPLTRQTKKGEEKPKKNADKA